MARVTVIKKQITIEPITLTARDWQLYTDFKKDGFRPARPHPYLKNEDGSPHMITDEVRWVVDPEGEKTIESEKCAKAMNEVFTDFVNSGCTAQEVYKAVQAVGWNFNSGASDSEPRGVLLDLLEDVFGRDAAERCW